MTATRYDELLRQRMNVAGINSWSALQKQAGISRRAMDQVRQGSLDTLKLSHLRGLATTLDWSLETFLSYFEHPETIASESETSPLIESSSSPNPDDSSYPEATELELTDQNQLRQECLRLRDQLQRQRHTLTHEIQAQIFQQLQGLLTSYPSARHLAQTQPEIPAKNITALLAPLDTLLQSWGYIPIGSVWDSVAFDPKLHQPDQNDIQPGESVYIRFVGYRQGDHIRCPAKVSRSLPQKEELEIGALEALTEQTALPSVNTPPMVTQPMPAAVDPTPTLNSERKPDDGTPLTQVISTASAEPMIAIEETDDELDLDHEDTLQDELDDGLRASLDDLDDSYEDDEEESELDDDDF